MLAAGLTGVNATLYLLSFYLSPFLSFLDAPLAELLVTAAVPLLDSFKKRRHCSHRLV